MALSGGICEVQQLHDMICWSNFLWQLAEAFTVRWRSGEFIENKWFQKYQISSILEKRLIWLPLLACKKKALWAYKPFSAAKNITMFAPATLYFVYKYRLKGSQLNTGTEPGSPSPALSLARQRALPPYTDHGEEGGSDPPHCSTEKLRAERASS